MRFALAALTASAAILPACADGAGTRSSPTPPVAATAQATPHPALSPAASAEPTRTRTPTEIDVGPYAVPTALAVQRYDSSLVFDLATGEIYVIKGAWSLQQWLDDDRLSSALGLQIDLLAGQITYDPPAPTATPAAPPPLTSADGTWRLDLSGDHAFLVDRDGGRRLDLPPSDSHGPQSQTYAWAPVGSLLAFGGGPCGDDPLLLVAPAAGTTFTLHEPQARGARAFAYSWRPDGLALAVGLRRAVGAAPEIVLFHVKGAATVLATFTGTSADPQPGEWNPSGTRFKFGLYSGRRCPY